MQQPSIPQTEHSVTKHSLNDVEAETSLSSLRAIPIINWGGEPLKHEDFDCMGWAGGPMVVVPPDDMSGSISREQFLTFGFTNLGPRGMGGGFSPDIIIYDEAHHYDKRMKNIMGPGFIISDHCRPFFEETYKMSHHMPVKEWSFQAPAHKPGETPRGTKPSFIGGKKKSKQQRAAAKARRKQR